MRKLSSKLAGQQSGFTLIELVIVIVIIGILAAVAIPNLGSTADEAKVSARTAILGMVKGAWGAAYAVKKSAPTGTEVIDQTLDPKCTATKCGDALIPLGAGVINSPADIVCNNCTIATISAT